MTYKTCNKCNKKISSSNFTKHFNKCNGIKEEKLKIDPSWLQESGKYKCPYCSNEYLFYGILTHIYRIHTEKGRNQKVYKDAFKVYYKNNNSWRKGLTKDTNDSIKRSSLKLSEINKKKAELGQTGIQLYMKNNKEAWLNGCSKGGGLRSNSGRGQKGWYKGYYYQSSWELAYIVYCIDHFIQIKRNTKGFLYVYKEKEYLYYPDFILNEEYIEIKGYKSNKWQAKLNQFPKKLKVLEKNDMKIYLDYVMEKYGKAFCEILNENKRDSSNG